MTPQHSFALEYARRGWFVFPIQPPTLGDRESGKRPITRNGKDDATTDEATINAWWTATPNANVGIALDKSGLVVLDVDVGLKKDGTPKRGAESLKEFDAELSPTLTAITGGGGLHAVYDAAGASIHALELREGLDVIGHGYIVAPPSLHYTGNTYRWNDLAPIAPVPDVLRRAVAAKRSAPIEKVELIGTPIGEGGRNIALFKLGAALRDQGIGAEALARALDAENRQRCNPPLNDAELGLIINSVLQRVTPSRDVAIGAVVEQEVRAALAPSTRAQWVGDIAMRPVPPMRWYSTGIPQLDEMTGGGFATRQVFGLIGPPSAGKSALANEWAMHLQQFAPVLQVSTELPHEECMVRVSAHEMEFPWRDGMKGKIPRDVMHNSVRKYRIKIVGSEDIDRTDPIGHIRAEALTIRDETGVMPFIVVDYVQMLARGSTDQVRHRVGELTMQLRILSQELDTVVIPVFSTSRSFYSGKQMEAVRAANDPTAYLAAAKEAGEIEYDCATLVFLDLDKMHEGQPKPARLAVARCRVGDVGFVGLRARLDVGKFFADPSAVAELASDERKLKRQADSLEQHCKRLVATVLKMPNRPWREIQQASGLNFEDAKAARAKLIEDQVVELVNRVGYDENHVKLKGTTLVVREQKPAPDVPSEEGV